MKIKQIRCTAEFIKEIDSIKRNINVGEINNPEKSFFYRGQSIIFPELKPGIFRKKISLIENEDKMISEFIRLKPHEFKNIENDFDMLAKMQHYGLKTRLLDITRNPLIALYFACSSSLKEDGEIFIICPDKVYNSTDFIVQLFSSFYKKSLFANESLEYVLKEAERSLRLKGILYESSEYEHIEETIKKIIDNKNEPICVLPAIFNEREARQRSGFLLFPDMISCKSTDLNTDKGDLCFIKKIIDYKASVINKMKSSIYVDKNRKEHILNELKELSIDQSYIFPELEYTAEEINLKYEK